MRMTNRGYQSQLMSRIRSGFGRPAGRTGQIQWTEPQRTALTGPDPIVGTNNAATQIPLIHIGIYPGVISYQELYPLVAADGAPIPATAPGAWGQLYAAGRM